VRGRRISPWGHIHVKDLAELVDRTVDVPLAAAHLDVGLVYGPAISNTMSAGSGGINKQRREPLHPTIDGDVVDLDPALGEQFLDIAVGQPEAQVPADRQHNHIGWEAEAGEGGPCCGSRTRAVSSHTDSLAARTQSPSMQQCHQRADGCDYTTRQASLP
jgi:hypothetical protein